MTLYTEASVLEEHKENVVPRANGRPVSKLSASMRLSQAQLIEVRNTEREEYEQKLSGLDMEDDPLQIYLDYINWTHLRYPQGANGESGLLRLLEKCTSSFRDVAHYKNDPRYLTIWLEYAKFADSQRDIFIYLAKKEIGSQLALFYEEFARHLILIDKWNDAREILEMGLKAKALPFTRLTQSYLRFLAEAKDNERGILLSSSSSRPALTAVGGGQVGPTNAPPPLSRNDSISNTSKRQKIEVFKDNNDQHTSISAQLLNHTPSMYQPDLGSFSMRRKENVIVAERWSGQLLRQQSGHERPVSKFQVYQDVEESTVPEIERTYETNKYGRVYTVVRQPGKTTEKVCVNMQLLQMDLENELCFEEVLARLMKPKLKKVACESLSNTVTQKALDTSSRPYTGDLYLNQPRSPTMTMYSKMANHEVINMFNDAAQELNSEDEVSVRREDTTTNFDGFVTETMNLPVKALEPEPTPPTDKEDEAEQGNAGLAPSSPFLEMPSMSYIEVPVQTVDPLDLQLRRKLLAQLSIPLSIYTTYHKSNMAVNKISGLREAIKSNKPVILDSFTNEGLISIRALLGKGGFGIVYLGETESAKPIAIKAEKPSSSWEYYILSQVHKRCNTSLVVKPHAFYEFQDESFLLMDYFAQGTILDVVNTFRQNNTTEQLGEEFAFYVASQLLKTVEKLHNAGIIHGDLKADNCVVNINRNTISKGLSSGIDDTIVLIDFGRSMDLALLPESTQFVSHWKTDNQDCTAMRNNQSWKYDADYFGIACIIHTVLFGEYIRTMTLSSGSLRLTSTWKRYWATELWQPLFDFLLNPYVGGEEERKPLLAHRLRLRYIEIDRHLMQPVHAAKLQSSLAAIYDNVSV